MVGRLMQLMKDTYAAMSLGCCCKDRISEIILRYDLAAWESEENTTFFYFFQRFKIQSGVAL